MMAIQWFYNYLKMVDFNVATNTDANRGNLKVKWMKTMDRLVCNISNSVPTPSSSYSSKSYMYCHITTVANLSMVFVLQKLCYCKAHATNVKMHTWSRRAHFRNEIASIPCLECSVCTRRLSRLTVRKANWEKEAKSKPNRLNWGAFDQASHITTTLPIVWLREGVELCINVHSTWNC